MDQIAIVLPTYNGEEFVRQQIQSIIEQTFTDWNLFIRDDGSTDNTVNIIKEMATLDSRINIIHGTENLGVKKGVFYLLDQVTADYYMTCDQDDFWLPNKIQDTLQVMKSTENGKQIPVLVHTDLVVADKNLNKISESMFNFQKLAPKYANFFQLAIQNNITGCTVMINNSLKKLLSYDPHMLMHDHWMGLVAFSFGKIGFLDKSTILYRQHGDNSVGAKEMSMSNVINSTKEQSQKEDIIERGFVQIHYYLEKYRNKLSNNDTTNIEMFLAIPESGFFKKLKIMKKLSLRKSSFIRSLYYLFVILFKQKTISER